MRGRARTGAASAGRAQVVNCKAIVANSPQAKGDTDARLVFPQARPPQRARADHADDPEEIARLKATVHCAIVLERATPPWRLDRRTSTPSALKYRRGEGEVIIVNHGGRGWWDPTHPAAKGDVFGLVQHLEPGLNFGEVRRRLRALAGIAPAFTGQLHRRPRPRPLVPIAERWAMAPALVIGSAVWRYLTATRDPRLAGPHPAPGHPA
ncbi:MAG: hypothetical protein WAS21_04175 [Geminicoccaceae bacterium]